MGLYYLKHFTSVSYNADRPVIIITDWDDEPLLLENVLVFSPPTNSRILDRLPAMVHVETESTVATCLCCSTYELAVELGIPNIDVVRVCRLL
jgi:hypothetical protein